MVKYKIGYAIFSIFSNALVKSIQKAFRPESGVCRACFDLGAVSVKSMLRETITIDEFLIYATELAGGEKWKKQSLFLLLPIVLLLSFFRTLHCQKGTILSRQSWCVIDVGTVYWGL